MRHDLFDQILAELARICPDEPPIGFTSIGGVSDEQFLIELRRIHDGAGEAGVGSAVERALDRGSP